MRAVVINKFGGPEVLEVQEIPKPFPQNGELLIKVVNTSVNYADIKNRTGGKAKANFPMILGLDAAGIVESVGAGVTNFKEGDRVICFPKGGAYAEYVVASELLCYQIPDSMNFRTAAACPIVSFLAYKLTYDLARIQDGDRVLVHAAAGGVGSMIVQMAKIRGAKQIIGTVSNLEKASLPLSLGASEVYTYEDFDQKVNRVTDGKGVDVIFDSLAGSITERSIGVLANFGKLIHFGNSSGEIGTFTTKDMHASCRSVLGFSLGTTRKERPETLKEVAIEVFELINSGQLQVQIGADFSLEDIAKAHELLSSRQSTGKIVIGVGE